MAELIGAQAFGGVTEGCARWSALLDAVELGGDELPRVDRVFCDCHPERLRELVEVTKYLPR